VRLREHRRSRQRDNRESDEQSAGAAARSRSHGLCSKSWAGRLNGIFVAIFRQYSIRREARLQARLPSGGLGLAKSWRILMKLSARNTLPGVVKKVKLGAVNAEVTLELAPGLTIVSVITRDAVKNLGLKKDKIAYAVIKASSVIVGVD
jgi:molybdopterin-binding protein